MTHTFKVGDKGKTRGGYDYLVKVTDLKGDYKIVAEITYSAEYVAAYFMLPNGQKNHNPVSSALDLMPPLATRTVWIPLLRSTSGGPFSGCNYDSHAEAKNSPDFEVIGIAKATITEGEGLDE